MRTIANLSPTTSGAYSANDNVGGLIQVQNLGVVADPCFALRSVTVVDKAGGAGAAMNVFLFRDDPSALITLTDNGALSIAAAADLIHAHVQVGAGSFVTAGGLSIASVGNLYIPVRYLQGKLYVALQTLSTPTYNNGTLFLKLGFDR